MTKLCYDGTHWSTALTIFKSMVSLYGPLAEYHGKKLGGKSAYGFLGPDVTRPGGSTNHIATATGVGWNQAWPEDAMSAPEITFTQDTQNSWRRGHLLNGEWNGVGENWKNLTPLTSQANANHATVETHVRDWLNKFRQFDEGAHGHRTFWYGIQYWVQVSTAPFAAADVDDGENLYGYCPNMIKVTWRIVRFNKPVGAAGTTANSHVTATESYLRAQSATAVGATAAQIEASITSGRPTKPSEVLPNSGANRDSAAADSAVHAVPPGAPAIPVPTSSYDGSVQVYQS